MSRGHDPREPLRPRVSAPERQPDTPSPHAQPRSSPPISVAGSSCTVRSRDALLAEPREVHEVRGRTYRLRQSEVQAMVELGKFRTVAHEHLIEFFYVGAEDRFRTDVNNLVRQGLLEIKRVPHEESGSRTLLTLTKHGHRFLAETQAAGKGQVLYHGFTNPRQAHHDADLYRLYQKAAEKIHQIGGKNLRVVLDYELKKRVYHDLANPGEERTSAAHKREVAERHNLQMVCGKIPLPDMRVEYETPEGERARIDLELATRHYRGRSLAETIRAGFSIYARGDEAAKLRKVLEARQLTAEISSL